MQPPSRIVSLVMAARRPGQRKRMLGALALSILFCACATEGEELPEESLDGAGAWVELGEYDFRSEADELLSPVVEIPDGGRGFALFVELEGCAQVALLEDDATQWVNGLESGPSCAACSERFSVVADAGVFVHDPESPVDGPVRFRLGQIACNTLTRARPGSNEPAGSAHLWVRPLPERSEAVVVPLRFEHGPFSSWSDSTRAAALVDEVSNILGPAGVELVIEGSVDAPDLPEELTWYEGDPSPLAAFVEPSDGVVDIVFGGCLQHVHPELKTETSLEGFVPRVPAEGTVGAGVYLSGRACTSADVEPTVLPIDVQARVLAHELGHYLGLYHVEDADHGSLMHPTPGFVLDPIVTEGQAATMRLHAALMAEGLPR